MCWIGRLDLKYAEEDIPIFKIMKLDSKRKNTVISAYFSTWYELGELKESDIIPESCGCWWIAPHQVNVALHSYNPLKIDVKNTIIHNRKRIRVFTKNSPFIDLYPIEYVVVKGYIPKGSRYCENKRGEIISDKLIMTEVCEPESTELQK